jgi:hypothetical protein
VVPAQVSSASSNNRTGSGFMGRRRGCRFPFKHRYAQFGEYQSGHENGIIRL